MATSGRLGSTPRSKRVLASVLSPSALLVRRTELALNDALSNTMVRVAGPTSESAPPMTPATAIGAAASAITSMSGDRLRDWPSSVVRRSPGRAVRT